jgi:hypothetical protein
MNRKLAANLALAFAALSGVAFVVAMNIVVLEPGPMPQRMPDPWTPALWAVAAQLLLVSGVWLAGFGYMEAKARSSLAVLLFAVMATWQLWFLV